MPIVNVSPTAPPVATPAKPLIAAPEYKGVVVDSRYIPTLGITTHIEGSSWLCDFFSQTLDTDNAVNGQNINRNPVYQQYKLIKGLELKVTSPLQQSQDSVGKSMIVSGTANVYPSVIPNEGDMFLADIGDGKEGVFRITSSERKAIYKETIHVIEYQLIDYSTEERRGDLLSKVVETVVFVKDFLKYGQNPLLQINEFNLIVRLKSFYKSIISRYFKLFTSNEYKTLLIPGQDTPVYDHFLTKTIFNYFSTYDTPDIRSIRILNCDGDDIMRCTTIWDAIRERDYSLLKYCVRQVGLVSARSFDMNAMLEGIFFSGVRYVVYPRDPELTVDYQIKYIEKVISDTKLLDAVSSLTQLGDLISDNEFEGLTLPNVPAVKKVLIDDYYVLSKDFYDRDYEETKMSLLEICVTTYLKNKPIDKRVLIHLCNTYQSWGALEQFYYTPLLLILLKSTILEV